MGDQYDHPARQGIARYGACPQMEDRPGRNGTVGNQLGSRPPSSDGDYESDKGDKGTGMSILDYLALVLIIPVAIFTILHLLRMALTKDYQKKVDEYDPSTKKKP